MTYSSSLAVGRQKYIKRNQNVVGFQPKTKRLGPISSTIIIVIMVCLLGLLYLTQIVKTNTYGYKVSELSTKEEQLKDEYADLQLESQRLQALERVKSSQVAQNLQPATPSGFVTN